MPRKGRSRLRRLRDQLVQAHPEVDDADALIMRGDVSVDGRIRTNPDSLVTPDARIAIRRSRPLRGEQKLDPVLDVMRAPVSGRVAMDVGAAAGGFTRTLLRRGARRVYAVDVGHGQLLGSLRQDARVVNLERTNLGDLDRAVIPDALDVVTVDLSYLSLAHAVPQLERVAFANDAALIALVKPQFELGLPAPPEDPRTLRSALERAQRAIDSGQWAVEGIYDSPIRGANGAVEFFVHAVRRR